MFLSRKKKKKNIRQKVAVKTEPKKRDWVLLFKIIVIGVIVLLLWSGWDYTKPSNFPIKTVQIISSYEHVDQALLQNKISSYIDNGFFYLNVIGMKRQLLKLPWVYVVSVQRKWPDAIVINIVEQQAILQWGAHALINPKGEVFMPPSSTFPKGLPVIFGPKEREFEIFTLYRKAQQLFESLDLVVEKLSFNQQKYWEILLSNETVVYLKESDPLGQLGLLTDLYRRITANHEYPPKSIDLRYNTDGLAVKWK